MAKSDIQELTTDDVGKLVPTTDAVDQMIPETTTDVAKVDEEVKPGWDENEQLMVAVEQKGLEEFGEEDVQIPWLRLMQGLSEAVTAGEAQSGQWVLDGFEPNDEVELVVGSAGKYRNLRDPDSREIVCAASDGKIGRGDPGGECAVCPHSKWTDDPKGGRMRPPTCSEGYSFMVYSITDSMFGRMHLERTGLQAAKSIIRDTKTAGSFGTRVFRLKSRHVQRANRSYYQAQVRVAKDVEVPEELAEAFSKLGG